MTNEQLLQEQVIALQKQVAALLEQQKKDALQIELDRQRIQYLEELVDLRTRELFGRKSEAVRKGTLGEQLSLFDDIELIQAIEEKERELKEKEEEIAKLNGDAKPARKPKRKNLVNMDNLRVVTETVKPKNLPENAVRMGSRVSSKLCYQKAGYYRKDTIFEVWKVENEDGTCEIYCEMDENRDAGTAFSNSMLDSSVVSDVIYNKTVLSLPLNRQEQDLARKGIQLSRQLMSSAIYRGYDAVRPIADRISDYIRKADNCRADETRLFIIECNGEKARIADPNKTQMSYVWLFMTAEGYHPAYSYIVGPTRKYENASKFFCVPVKHRYLQTDDYGAYDRLENTDRIPCLVHTKRKFFDAMKTAGEDGPQTESEKIVGMISMIHRADDLILAQLADRKGTAEYYDLVKEQRLLTVKPLIDAFYAELDRIVDRVPPKSNLGKAIAYAMGHRKLSYNFFLDGRLTLSNNSAESKGIKPLVIGRKNWLFANTEKGAIVTSTMYSLVETAMANGLDPYEYLKWLFDSLPYREMPDFPYDDYLPWSDKVPTAVRNPAKGENKQEK